MNKFKTFMVNLWVKVQNNKNAFIFLLFYYIAGCVYYGTRPELSGSSYSDIMLIALDLKTPPIDGILSNLYLNVWEIFIELIIFGFIVSLLLDHISPETTSFKLARTMKDHAIVIGLTHIGERLVDLLIEKKAPYVLIDKDKEVVRKLISIKQPVIVGDATDEETLMLANVDKAREVYICVDMPREIIVIAEKIRAINGDCNLIVRVWNEDVGEYLKMPPISAFTFSSSQWTFEKLKGEVEKIQKTVLILGWNHLAQRMAEYMGLTLKRKVVLIDPTIDPDLYDEKPYENILAVRDECQKIILIQDHVSFDEIGAVFLLWNEEDQFSATISLVSEFNNKFPDIRVYARIFDRELEKILKRFDAEIFSSSEIALNKLREGVKQATLIK